MILSGGRGHLRSIQSRDGGSTAQPGRATASQPPTFSLPQAAAGAHGSTALPDSWGPHLCCSCRHCSGPAFSVASGDHQAPETGRSPGPYACSLWVAGTVSPDTMHIRTRRQMAWSLGPPVSLWLLCGSGLLFMSWRRWRLTSQVLRFYHPFEHLLSVESSEWECSRSELALASHLGPILLSGQKGRLEVCMNWGFEGQVCAPPLKSHWPEA